MSGGSVGAARRSPVRRVETTVYRATGTVAAALFGGTGAWPRLGGREVEGVGPARDPRSNVSAARGRRRDYLRCVAMFV